jgi:hypothetical protein
MAAAQTAKPALILAFSPEEKEKHSPGACSRKVLVVAMQYIFRCVCPGQDRK